MQSTNTKRLRATAPPFRPCPSGDAADEAKTGAAETTTVLRGVFPNSTHATKADIAAREAQRREKLASAGAHHRDTRPLEDAKESHTKPKAQHDNPQNHIDMSAYTASGMASHPEVLANAFSSCVVGVVTSVRTDDDKRIGPPVLYRDDHAKKEEEEEDISTASTNKDACDAHREAETSTASLKSSYSHWFAFVHLMDLSVVRREIERADLDRSNMSRSGTACDYLTNMAETGVLDCTANSVRRGAHTLLPTATWTRSKQHATHVRGAYLPKSAMMPVPTRLLTFPAWPTAASVPPSIGDLIVGDLTPSRGSMRFSRATFICQQDVSFLALAKHGILVDTAPMLRLTLSHTFGDIQFVILALLGDNEPRFSVLTDSTLDVRPFESLASVVQFVSERTHRPLIWTSFCKLTRTHADERATPAKRNVVMPRHTAVWM